MKQTVITFPSGNTAIRLEPADGYKYITNGDARTVLVTVKDESMVSNWHDTNDEPPDPADPETQELADVVNDAYEMANELI